MLVIGVGLVNRRTIIRNHQQQSAFYMQKGPHIQQCHKIIMHQMRLWLWLFLFGKGKSLSILPGTHRYESINPPQLNPCPNKHPISTNCAVPASFHSRCFSIGRPASQLLKSTTNLPDRDGYKYPPRGLCGSGANYWYFNLNFLLNALMH